MKQMRQKLSNHLQTITVHYTYGNSSAVFFLSLSLFSYSGIFFKQIFFIEKLVKTNCAVCTIVPILFVYIQWFTIVTLIFIQQTSFNLLWWAENIIFIIELPIYSSPLNDSVW